MEFLKKRTESLTPVKDVLDTILGGEDRPLSRRVLHASDLTRTPEFCPRQVAYEDMGVRRRPSYLPGPMQVTFHDGLDKQDRVSMYLKDYLIGDWECASCGKSFLWTKFPKATGCSRDAKCRIKYREVMFRHSELGFVGRVDAFFVLGGRARLVEMKIMADHLLQKLSAPLAEHRLRTNLYLDLVRNSDHLGRSDVRTDEASILYINRGYGRKDAKGLISPFREYVVKRDSSALSEPHGKAAVVNRWRASGKSLMPCRACAGSAQGKSRRCHSVSRCFSEAEGVLTWPGPDGPRHKGEGIIAIG